MATIMLSAAGAAAGSVLGGSAMGLSTAVLGRALGATVGRSLDQHLLGAGSQAVESGRVDRFRLTGASEGAPVERVWGRTRVSGQVIWASRFRENVTVSQSGSGKGIAPGRDETRAYSYSVNLAIALCEGAISSVGRIWADGTEIARDTVSMRVYEGGEDQQPDPLIEAVEGAGHAPAYRGIAYVVFEELELGRFGNRVPQFSFEVTRPAKGGADDLQSLVQGVSLIPGTGEYALATTPVHFDFGLGHAKSANVNSPSGQTDFLTSLEDLRGVLPHTRSVSLVVSWFSGDLRAPFAAIRPKVEQKDHDGVPMPWQVSGLARTQAQAVPRLNDGVVYGGTPTDASVVEAIRELHRGGQDAVFYPFILMDQLPGNTLPDPYSDGAGQAHFPWRGRITLSKAPDQPLSPDGTSLAEDEVAAFFGTTQVTDFAVSGDTVSYSGSEDWGYRRFILHYAHLCAAAGGVEGFCIGSELRGLTTIRGQAQSFPAVEALRKLAADVRSILGVGCKIGYAADWSEYYGYQPADAPGDLYFHLDPLWADSNIDFIGIDNYVPLSDWRDGGNHADAEYGTIYSLTYLRSNIEGGEGYDWYYPSEADRVSQNRVQISDGEHGEPWVWRFKDIRNWWGRSHHNRIAGVRNPNTTEWTPRSKPIWFTELGCPAVDKGSNAPNLFHDLKSSESALAPFSTGGRDDLIQHQYLRAVLTYWSDPEVNPVSDIYGEPMIDLSRAHVWAWDARPFPQFPNNNALWSDAPNYQVGHWLNGRASAQSLASVAKEICCSSGVQEVDVSELYGLVRGYSAPDAETPRATLQPLMLAYGAEVVEREGQIVLFNRSLQKPVDVDQSNLAVTEELSGQVEYTRNPVDEAGGRVRLSYIESYGVYETRSVEACLPDCDGHTVATCEFPLVLSGGEGHGIVNRWLAQAQVARDCARFALPPSSLSIAAGNVIRLPEGEYRIDRIEHTELRRVEAVRVEQTSLWQHGDHGDHVAQEPFRPVLPVYSLFLDLPLLSGDEVPHAPYLAATSTPWSGGVAVYSAAADYGYRFNTSVDHAAVIGVTENPLLPVAPSRWDRGASVRVRLSSGELGSVSELDLLVGANTAAIGDGSPQGWEVFQFATAELVGPQTYDLSLRLRGQAGTDAEAATPWPAGSLFVLLDDAPVQISVPQAALSLPRHYRVGPHDQGYDDLSFRHHVVAFDGTGLRPYAPCHLRADRDQAGNLNLRWIRRTRSNGDSWASMEVPLGEQRESYHVRVLGADETVTRTDTVETPAWFYSLAMQVEDGIASPFSIEVAQISDQVGPGPYRRIEIDD
ncbi:host specificity protein [Rhodovulum sp. P5]|uniref:baseplate multidomain protein megatron n=1 Tax=Rhodovulum sp. P5 TaxID=1564506 RepID=UPI0009C2B267|nr:glycoside hydrolase/phage tail family protein [Rhodovulum sp. P5]ARE38448.1 host specificity protein [Rhodovulum sp. P5]